ncbi:unnamed protein product [Prunus armeniaca]
MDTVGILVCYNGSWVKKDNIDSYEGEEAKGIIVSRNVTFSDLVQRIYKIMDADPTKYIVTLKYSVPVSSYNTDVMASKVTPLVASLKNIEGHGIEGCNGIVSVESSNAHADFVVEQRNVVIRDNETENGGNDFNWSDWVEEVNFESGENIVADFNEPSNEEEPQSAPILHPHEDSNVEPSTVQCRQVQSEPPRQSSSTEMHTSRADLKHGQSLEYIQYGGGVSCINWEANLKVGRVYPNKIALLKTISLAAITSHFRLRTVQSGKHRLCVRCWQLPCPWKVRAYKVGLHEFKVVKYDPLHECDLRYVSSHHPQATTELLSDCVKWRFQDSRSIYTTADIKKDVKQNFGVSISYSTAWRSRELAFKRISSLPIVMNWSCKYKGVLFVVTAFDGNQNIYPVAFGIGDLETDAAWEWFLRKRHCAIGNIKASFKLKQWDPILGINNDRVRTYLLRAGVQKWSRAHCDGRRYNVMTTNIVESINSVLRQRRELAMKSHSTLCPDLGEKKLRKRLDAASRMNVVKINNVEFNVLDGDLNGLVHLQNRSCTCRKFDLEQLPCKHAIAVCRHLKLNPYSFASSYYTRATWAAAYAESIYPIPPEGTWVILENLKKVKILPPLCKVMPGHRKTQRIASKGEESRQKKCSRCGVKGHYRSTCKQSVPLTNKQHVA